MTRLKRTLRFDLEVTVEERDGYFAASTKPFAITAYGDTTDEAEKRALKATSLLLIKHSTTPGELGNYLSRFGVKHILGTAVETTQRYPVVRECRQEIRLEVPAGV